ncbi:hypothetical protein, partial [Lactobacillus delbrueckii]|uniref:hypothetical protein n=2 Tax=Lactobacillus delbrueckii TaxID=1584 RepID=UPI0021A42FF2
GSCVFVVINIVRDNPSFFVAYFLFTQEFILNLFLDDSLGTKLFDIFCLLSFFWVPAITSFKGARNIPDNLQLTLTPGNATETPDTPSLKVRYADTKIDRFKNAILFDTPNFYIIICYNNAADKKVRLIYNIISKKQNNNILAKFNFVKTISPDLKKIRFSINSCVNRK